MNDITKDKVANAIALLEAAAGQEQDELDANAIGAHKNLLNKLLHPELLDAERAEREAAMAAGPQLVGRRYFLCEHDDTLVVYEASAWSDGHLSKQVAWRVVDKSLEDPCARYADIPGTDWPLDLTISGREISEEEMKELTGFYMDGHAALDDLITHIMSQTERVRQDDPYYDKAQSLLVLAMCLDRGLFCD